MGCVLTAQSYCRLGKSRESRAILLVAPTSGGLAANFDVRILQFELSLDAFERFAKIF